MVGLDEKGLCAIPNVGGHPARKIVEFRDTGVGAGAGLVHHVIDEAGLLLREPAPGAAAVPQGLVGGAAWLLVAALPGLRARWAVARAAGGLIRRMLGVRLSVTGQIPPGARPLVVVANHASFIDGLVVMLCVPGPLRFVASERFAAQRIAGPFLRRIGCEFVRPGGPEQAAAATRRLAVALAAGRSLAIWPEGSLDPAPGLRPFHLGAFEAAAASGTPVIPVGIRGTRDVLRPAAGSRGEPRSASP
jgi:1-acyl-sn-glycerol-3-phosphate acyltransferase